MVRNLLLPRERALPATWRGIDPKVPLLGDFAGAMINVGFLSIDQDRDVIHLYTPVFRNTVYKIASPWGITFRRSKSR
jgi:hypothetical protein